MCLEYGECGVTVAHAPWEGGEQFNSDIFHHLLMICHNKPLSKGCGVDLNNH